VNGMRARIGLVPLAPRPGTPRGARPAISTSTVDTVLSILRSIHPEHIQEVTFEDCFKTSVEVNHGNMAMFIVLKPGVAFEPGRGSYIPDELPGVKHAAAEGAGRASNGAGNGAQVADTAPSVIHAQSLPPYRHRVIGVYEASGDPIPEVEIVDVATGVSARTTSTGTASLF